MSISELFSERLKKLRKAAGLTQGELAKKLGMSQEGISHWERNKREPSWSQVVELAKALGVDCTAFLGNAPEAKKK